MSNSYIELRIAERKREADSLKAEAAKIEMRLTILAAEVRAYQDALSHVENIGITPNGDEPTERGFATRMTPAWRVVFETLCDAYPGTLTKDEIAAAAANEGKPVIDQTLRSGLSSYTNRKWLERVRVGVYRITPEGAASIGRSLDSEPPPPRPAMTPAQAAMSPEVLELLGLPEADAADSDQEPAAG